MAALKFESKELKAAALTAIEKDLAAAGVKRNKAFAAYEKTKVAYADLENARAAVKAARVSKPKA